MKKCSMPSVFPHEGTYDFSNIHVHLSCMTKDAVIRYTLDGSEPDENSPVYTEGEGLILLKNTPDCHRYILKAYAAADGMEKSKTVTFEYRFICQNKGEYRHTMLRKRSFNTSGIIQIEDFDLDKMYLVIGTNKAILIDAGWDETGDLVGLCRDLIGEDMPLELVVAHGHSDHVAHIPRFLDAGIKVYIPFADKEIALQSLDETIFSNALVSDVKENDVFDLGGTMLKVYAVRGHTEGGVVLVDEKTGDVFASDEFGSNRRYVPDSAWMQLSEISIEECLESLKDFREKTKGKIKRIFSGHNDEPLPAELYLDTLQNAFQSVVDGGEDALKPSPRNAKETFGSGTVCIEGDWRYDPVWAAANLKYIYKKDRLKCPPRYAKGFNGHSV